MQIAITGMGIVSAIGLSVADFHEALLSNDVGIRVMKPNSPDASLYGLIHDDFDPSRWMDDRVIDGTDGFAQFALAACAQALADAGLDGEDTLDKLRTGVVHGTSMGGTVSLQKNQWILDTRGPEAVDRKLQLKMWPNMAAAQICMRYDLHGRSLTVTTACASGIDALGTAAGFLGTGQADVVLCGASEHGYSADSPEDADFMPAAGASGRSLGMANQSIDARRACIPFDADRAGLVAGEGSAFFVLETAANAARRGARVHAWLRGYGSLADGYHPSAPEPQGTWEARAMELAQTSAGIGPGEVEVLIAHATSTRKGDEAEIRAINRVFVDRSDRGGPIVTALKANTGHTGGSSGAMNVVAGICAMHDGKLFNIPSTRNLDPEARFDVVLTEPRDVRFNVFQSNSFGFGGQNASIVVTKEL